MATGIRKTVLVVDDNAEVLMLATRTLQANYNVLTANGGADALQKAAGYGPEIHLLVTDFQMPGMSGIALATQLTLERPDLQVLLISGFMEIGLKNGWRFLAKPFTPSQLIASIQNILSPPTATITSGPLRKEG